MDGWDGEWNKPHFPYIRDDLSLKSSDRGTPTLNFVTSLFIFVCKRREWLLYKIVVFSDKTYESNTPVLLLLWIEYSIQNK